MSKNTTTTTTTTTVTPYAAAKLVNLALADAGLDKKIPPQMMYNYTLGRVNAGKDPFIKVDSHGKIAVEDLAEWIAVYVGKQVAKAAEQAEQAEPQAEPPAEPQAEPQAELVADENAS